MKRTLTGLAYQFVGLRPFGGAANNKPFSFYHKSTCFTFNAVRKRDFIQAKTPTAENLMKARVLNEEFRQYLKDNACT